MRGHSKGFSLVELLITVSLVSILAAVAIPNFTSTVQSNRADTEVGDLQHALNYARLEAINRGVTIRIAPASGTDWSSTLQVTDSASTVIRSVPGMTAGAAVSAVAGSSNATALEFNNLGGLVTPSAAVVMGYTRGTISKSLNICLTGRIVLNTYGSC